MPNNRMNWHRVLLLCGTFLPPCAAQAATSENYALEPAALDNGGLTTNSTNYHANASATPGALAYSSSYTSRTGFAGQLYDGVAITLPTLTVNEGANCQLSATLVCDDQTTTSLAAASLTWSVLSGPVSAVSGAGLATAGTVYQDGQALVRGEYQTFAATLELSVLNTSDDNFGAYAADGIPDAWQVQYFGLPPNPMAAAAATPSGNGLNNLQKFAFGMNPLQGSAPPVTWNGTAQVEGGVPTQLASTSDGSFTFRAIYARRKDYVAAHLSYTAEFSGDLLTWMASTATPAVLADDGHMQAVSVPYPLFVAGKKARYFRMKVEIP